MLKKRKIADTDIDMIYIEDEVIGKALTETGYWEPQLTKWFIKTIKSFNREALFIDIGAHAGYFSLLSTLNSNMYTISFEPNPIQYGILEVNAQGRSIYNIQAAYDNSSAFLEKTMYGNLNNTGDNGEGDNDYYYEVVTANLFDVIYDIPERFAIFDIGIIKIDTQGNEFQIFEWLQKELKDYESKHKKIWYITEVSGPKDPFVLYLMKHDILFETFLHYGAPNKDEADIAFQI